MFYETLITIMKKNIWIWALAAIFVAACSSNDDPIQEQPVTDNDWISPDGQVVIQLGGGESKASASTTVTRAPITNVNFTGTNVGVFALAINPGTDVNATSWATPEGALLSNIQGVIQEKDKPTDGSVTDAKKISLYRSEASGAVYYYPMDNKYDYSFYGYAPYQSSANVTANTATVTIPFDGSQDIMWNKSAATTIPVGGIRLDSENQDRNTSELTGYKAKYIRQLKYNFEIDSETIYKQWVPNINFGHQLTQFTFQVVAAKKQSAEDKANAQKLKVKNIKIKGHGKTATLNVLNGEITWSGNEDLAMLDITSNLAAAGEFAPSIAEDGGDKVGYLMAKPTTTSGTATPFDLEVTVIAPTDGGQTSIPATQTITIPLNKANGFDKGIIYNVQIGIYAMQEVMVDATLTEWTEFDGGNIEAPVE